MDAVVAGVIGLITIVVNILVLSIGGTWKLSELKASLVRAISDAKDDVEMKQDTHSHNVGETIAAIRQKITENELWNRDNFVRRDEFWKALNSQTEMIKAMGEKIELRLERMETKIDSKTTTTNKTVK